METHRTDELRVWYDSEGKFMDLPDLSKPPNANTRQSKTIYGIDLSLNILKFSAPMKTFSQILAEGLGLSDKADFINVKAMTTAIKKDSVVYMVRINLTIHENSFVRL